MVNPDTNKLIEDLHRHNDQLAVILETISHMTGHHPASLQAAESLLIEFMREVEESVP